MRVGKRLVTFAGLAVGCGLLVSIVLGQGEPAEWRGVVIGPTGQPVADAKLRLRMPNGGCVWDAELHRTAYASSDEEGRFRIRQSKGEMEIYASHPDYAPVWVNAGPDAVIKLRRACYLEMDVNVPADVAVCRGQWRFAHAAGSGVLRCGPLPPDTALSWNLEANGYRMQFGTVMLKEGETRRLSATLDPGLSLRGRLQPRREGIEVWCYQKDSTRQIAVTDQRGVFELRGLTEGGARLIALVPSEQHCVVDVTVGDSVVVRWK